MKYLARTAGSEHEVEIRSGQAGLLARMGEVEVAVEVDRGRGPGSFTLGFGRRVVPVTVLEVEGGTYEILLAGRRHRVSVEAEVDRLLRRGDEEGKGRPSVVRSVMPGIVTRVLAGKGNHVDAGEPLLILEAMKMENEVRSEKAGLVLEVHVQSGSTVQSGAPLFTIGPDPGGAAPGP
jgi:biotin carboxyl carrier protein